MACCYIAASMIAFIIRTCDVLNVDLNLQYNESLDPSKHHEDVEESEGKQQTKTAGISTISITGMTCSACTTTIEKALLEVKGVESALVSLHFQEARVFHATDLDTKTLVSAVENVGYEAVPGERGATQKIETLQQQVELQSLSQCLSKLSVISTIILVLGDGLDYAGLYPIVDTYQMSGLRQMVLFVLAATAAFRYSKWIFGSASDQAKRFRVNMHSLISASTLLGLSLSVFNVFMTTSGRSATYYNTVVGVLFIVTAGRYVDLLSRRQATNTFIGLYSLLEETSSVKLLNGKRKMPTSLLRPADEIIIAPYSVVPCDCYVTAGTSYVNEAVITGEAAPKTKGVGHFLFAGSRNGPGELHARLNEDQTGSFLAQLIHGVEDSLNSKMPTQQYIDVITQYFVVVIFAIAITASVSTFMKTPANVGIDGRLNLAARQMMTLLAAACPCALGLATPCAIMAGIDVAWRQGILVMGGAPIMEQLKRVTYVVMDKTGTLTEGKLRVSQIIHTTDWRNDEKTFATLVCAAEESGGSAHPVGAAVFRTLLPVAGESWSIYKAHGDIRNLKEVAGRGVICEVDLGDQHWRSVCLGSNAFMAENQVDGITPQARDCSIDGSMVFIAIDGNVAGTISLKDTVRMDAKDTIDALKTRGLELAMLTGDTPEEASRISQELGIPVLASSAMPHKKLDHIKNLQSKGHVVAMLGDGMNDGPSLGASDVGIMMAHGKKCFSTGGSVLILNAQLHSLISLFDIARTTLRQVTFSIAWALVYNFAAVGLALGFGARYGIHITPAIAAAMMSFSSVTITAQGLLLRQRLLRRYQRD
ncbi:hypothetical protein LTR20_003682 [Exophiala xenobiotica]|nr:hypothetical protein LTS06_011326 [Exophiala xenobiotica]KAK5281958.1 hypothetical protein LTR40_004015 [Exophiala xenobiotica]KAK5373651.1 hypothetical protein LTS13_005850 [Exophiala xenobiotica]KAK5402331.1 hypothetical protein LTR79_001059 [Exophiala xenobiotica]KAK5419247.1 hypothetical protein LTR90_004310 [Exophiala xenobiotica]